MCVKIGCPLVALVSSDWISVVVEEGLFKVNSNVPVVALNVSVDKEMLLGEGEQRQDCDSP